MIKNYLCRTCNHQLVCDMYDKKISIFSLEAKKQLGIDVEIKGCKNYSPTGEEVINEAELEEE